IPCMNRWMEQRKRIPVLRRSGYTEQSNVNVVKEMVDMITITRAYEANQKVIRSYDSMLDRAVNSVGRLNG
ncbi:MAG: flagellar basal body rod C-terminal domain-containing protein, partial [Eubacterium sp.]